MPKNRVVIELQEVDENGKSKGQTYEEPKSDFVKLMSKTGFEELVADYEERKEKKKEMTPEKRVKKGKGVEGERRALF